MLLMVIPILLTLEVKKMGLANTTFNGLWYLWYSDLLGHIKPLK